MDRDHPRIAEIDIRDMVKKKKGRGVAAALIFYRFSDKELECPAVHQLKVVLLVSRLDRGDGRSVSRIGLAVLQSGLERAVDPVGVPLVPGAERDVMLDDGGEEGVDVLVGNGILAVVVAASQCQGLGSFKGAAEGYDELVLPVLVEVGVHLEAARSRRSRQSRRP